MLALVREMGVGITTMRAGSEGEPLLSLLQQSQVTNSDNQDQGAPFDEVKEALEQTEASC